jgi:hypothetical protein
LRLHGGERSIAASGTTVARKTISSSGGRHTGHKIGQIGREYWNTC